MGPSESDHGGQIRHINSKVRLKMKQAKMDPIQTIAEHNYRCQSLADIRHLQITRYSIV